MTVDALLLLGAAIALCIASVFALIEWMTGHATGIRRVRVGVALAIALLLASIIARGVSLSAFPMTSVHDGLVFFACFVSCVSWAVSRRNMPQVMLLSTPLVAITSVVGVLVPATQSVPEALRSAWLWVHISFALLGDAMLFVAGVVACVFLVHERRLKRKKSATKQGAGRTMSNLPALEALDRVGANLVRFGFPLMTLGLVSGAVYGKHVWGHYWVWDPRSTVSLLAWLLYAIMIQARLMVGWRGRKAAILTVVGVVAILLAFVGLGILGVGLHGEDYAS